MKSVFDVCLHPKEMAGAMRSSASRKSSTGGGSPSMSWQQSTTTATTGPVTTRVPTGATSTTSPQGEVSTSADVSKGSGPIQRTLSKVQHEVPMMTPVTGMLSNVVQRASAGMPAVGAGGGASAAAAAADFDRLSSNVDTGKGEEKHTFGETIRKLNLPTVGIFPASAKCAIHTIRSLCSYPNRNTCAKINCIIRNDKHISTIRSQLGHNVTDAFSWSFADFCDSKSMTSAFIGCDRLLLIPPNTEDRGELICEGIAAAKLAGVSHIVLLSAVSAEHPGSVFGKHFYKMEKFLLDQGVNFTILRMAWFMDNFLDFAPDLVRDNHFYSSWGPSGLAPVALADVGRSAATVLCAPTTNTANVGRIFSITGPESMSGFRMAQVLTKVLQRPIQYQDLPKEDMKKMYLEMGIPEWQAKGYVDMNEVFKSGGAAAYSRDVECLTQGNHTSFEQYLRTKRWFFLGQPSPVICVLPASGRVGSATLAALMKDSGGSRVRAVVRSPSAKAELESKYGKDERFSVVYGDFEGESSIRSAIEGVDSLIIIPPERLEKFSVIDDAIKIAHDAWVTHTVLFSVSRALIDTAIGRKFHAWERVLEQHSWTYTIVQSSVFHDLMFYFAEQAKQPDHTIHHWLGQGKFCPVDSRDVGAANATILREGPLSHNKRCYTLYGPQALSFADLCQALSRVTGYEITAIDDITSDQVRSTLDDKIPSFNVEEVVQAHEFIANHNDVDMTPDLLKLIGHAKTAQAFFEDHRHKFEDRKYIKPLPYELPKTEYITGNLSSEQFEEKEEFSTTEMAGTTELYERKPPTAISEPTISKAAATTTMEEASSYEVDKSKEMYTSTTTVEETPIMSTEIQ